jgi:hypothetical protein
MRIVFEFMYRAALAIWIGSLVCFSFLVAPTLFAQLDSAIAGNVVGQILDRYARLAVACGAIAALSALGLARLDPERHAKRWAAAILAGMIVLTLYASEGIAPKARELRAAMHEPGLSEAAAAEARIAFGQVHRRSVMVHGAVLLLGASLLVLEARRTAEG